MGYTKNIPWGLFIHFALILHKLFPKLEEESGVEKLMIK